MSTNTYFQLMFSDGNLTFRTKNYAVKRTFVCDDRLEMMDLKDKAEEENLPLSITKEVLCLYFPN